VSLWHGQGELYFSFHCLVFMYWKFKSGPPEEYPLMGFCTSCNITQLYSEELHNLSSPLDIIRLVKSRRMRRVGHEAGI
jgi:hypothetical protein